MPIADIAQPEFIQIDPALRLHRYDGHFDFAWDWYQDPAMVMLVDGVDTPYTMDRLTRMYEYLNQHGELYFIELLEDGAYRPIGDVTFWQEDMPIVIGDPACRGKGIGRKVVSALVQRGRELGYDSLTVNEIYDFNTGSRKCFEAAGFQAYEQTERGHRYRKVLSAPVSHQS